MMKTILRIYLCLILIVSLAIISACKIDPPYKRLSFALKRDSNNNYKLLHIDVINNKIVKESPLKFRYQYITYDSKKNRVYLSRTRGDWGFYRQIDIYDIKKQKLVKPIHTKYLGPSLVIPHGDDLVVIEEGGDQASGLYVCKYSTKGKFINETKLDNMANCYPDYIEIYDNKILLTKNQLYMKTLYRTDSYFMEIELENLSIMRNEQFKAIPELNGISTIAFNPSQNILYVGPYTVGLTKENRLINKSVYVFTFPDLNLVTKILTPGQPNEYKYVKETNKLYISHHRGFCVVDCSTNKIIKEWPYSIYRMEYIGNNKMLLSLYGFVWKQREGKWISEPSDNKLIILDTLKDEVVKEFIGDFGPVARSL
jgi:hypothetical protein